MYLNITDEGLNIRSGPQISQSLVRIHRLKHLEAGLIHEVGDEDAHKRLTFNNKDDRAVFRIRHEI